MKNDATRKTWMNHVNRMYAMSLLLFLCHSRCCNGSLIAKNLLMPTAATNLNDAVTENPKMSSHQPKMMFSILSFAFLKCSMITAPEITFQNLSRNSFVSFKRKLLLTCFVLQREVNSLQNTIFAVCNMCA